MSFRLEGALEVTDGLWDLVPVVVATGEQHDQRSPAEAADASPAGLCLTPESMTRVRAAYDLLRAMQDEAVDGQQFDESVASSLTLREVMADPFGLIARVMNIPEQTEAIVKALGNLASLVHEIATPVSAISGFAVALADGSVQTPAERAEAADVVIAETGRLQQLLDDVRQLNQLELTESVHHEHTDLGALCNQAAQRFRIAARDAGVTVTARAAHAWLDTDPRLIDAILSNFVSNAIRYTPRGGKVEIRAVIIAVRDTGTGIEPSHLEKIFDRLYRTNDAGTARAADPGSAWPSPAAPPARSAPASR